MRKLISGLVVLGIISIMAIGVCADVKVEKVTNDRVKVTVTPAQRIIRDTVDINQVDRQKKNMAMELDQLDNATFISEKRQEAIAAFDAQIEQRKALLTENIKVYDEIISKASALGVNVTVEEIGEIE